MFVKAGFELNDFVDDERTANAEGQSKHIEKGVNLVSLKVSECRNEVISKHAQSALKGAAFWRANIVPIEKGGLQPPLVMFYLNAVKKPNIKLSGDVQNWALDGHIYVPLRMIGRSNQRARLHIL